MFFSPTVFKSDSLLKKYHPTLIVRQTFGHGLDTGRLIEFLIYKIFPFSCFLGLMRFETIRIIKHTFELTIIFFQGKHQQMCALTAKY